MTSDRFPIPAAALQNHIAILGKTGSGKTSTAKLIVEHLADEGDRVCILDPLKSDWWGLISSDDGKAPGLPFQILGGPRGHVPLHSSAGRAIGEIVGAGKLPLSIVDMADFEPGGLQRFFVDFAAALMKSARGVVYLVIEEAHEFAPKERVGVGAESLAIHWAKKLATAGRSKGIRLIFSTQRTQSLHNACLSSCETIIAHRLTTPDAQAPVVKWLRANTDKATAAKVEASLASLKTGTGWTCSGEARLFAQIAFPKFRTYDNSRTPTRTRGGAADVQVAEASVDAEALRALIGDAVAEAAANDPAALKAEIARLKKAAAGPTIGDVSRIEAAAEQRGYARGWADAVDPNSNPRLAAAIGMIAEADRELQRASEHLQRAHREIRSNPPAPAGDGRAGSGGGRAEEPPPPRKAPPAVAKPRGGERAVNGSDPTARSTASPKETGLKKAHQRTLDAIAFFEAVGQRPVPRDRAAVMAGLSPRASTFGVYVGQLIRDGYVESAPGSVSLTEQGRAAANHPDLATAEALYEQCVSLLAAQEKRVFDVVYEALGEPVKRVEIAERLGLSPTASTCGVYISKVAAYGLIQPSGPGAVSAADWLFF